MLSGQILIRSFSANQVSDMDEMIPARQSGKTTEIAPRTSFNLLIPFDEYKSDRINRILFGEWGEISRFVNVNIDLSFAHR